MVEGSGTTFVNDQLQHTIEILEHIACGNSNRPNACLRQPLVAIRVGTRSIAKIVTCTVYLDAQARSVAIEIEHVRTGGMLLPKFEAIRPLPQMLPQHDLREAHLPSEFASPFDIPSRASEHSPPPPPAVPLP